MTRMETNYERRRREYVAASYELTLEDPISAYDLAALECMVAAETRGQVLDIGCGAGWLTRFISGDVIAVDQSKSRLQVAAERVPHGRFVWATLPPLPFLDDSFDIALSSHVYGHFESEGEGEAFLKEALRVARELIIVEQTSLPGLPRDGWEDRLGSDGSTGKMYKRYFTALELANEIGGRVLLDTPTFVAAVVRPEREAGLLNAFPSIEQDPS